MNKLLKEDFSLKISPSLYPKNVLMRVCYSLSNEAQFFVREEELYIVDVKLINNCTEERLKEMFASALMDFTLRNEIEEKTKVIRDTIVKAALAELT